MVLPLGGGPPGFMRVIDGEGDEMAGGAINAQITREGSLRWETE